MSIVKNTPDILKHNGLSFTTLINDTIELIENPAALGIYVYLASKPSDWIINETNLQNRFNKGRDFIRDRIDELKTLGLLKKYSVRDDKGLIVRWETVLFSQPYIKQDQIPENPECGKSESTFLKNQVPGKTRCLEKPTHTNKGYIQIKEKNKDLVRLSDESVSEVKNLSGKKVVTADNYRTHPMFSLYQKFYAQYPKHEQPYAGFRAFMKLKPTEELIEKIILDAQKRFEHREDRQFIPLPASYLNGRHWEGEVIKPSIASQTYRSPQERAKNELSIQDREHIAAKNKRVEMDTLRKLNELVNNKPSEEQRNYGIQSLRAIKDILATG